MLATASLQSYQFICQSQYQLLYALCQILHASYNIPAFIYRHMSAKSFLWVAQVSLYVNLSCYMSNCYILVYVPSALFHMLYAEYYGLYAKLHMLDCNMPNAMTIAMSFSMTTEQVGHLIIYIYLLPSYDSPYCCYREESIVIPPWFQFISQVSGIQFVSTSGYWYPTSIGDHV
jgi:hypothetical protein